MSIADSDGPLPMTVGYPPCACLRCRAGQAVTRVSTTRQEAEVPPGTGMMRAAATWFIDQPTLPRHQLLKLFSQDFEHFLYELVPQIEKLAGCRAQENASAGAALAGVGEARRRLEEPEAAGLDGEVARVKRLARSVVDLCTHYDTLSGITLCVLCESLIEDGDEAVPYHDDSPSRGNAGSGRVHNLCAKAVRRR